MSKFKVGDKVVRINQDNGKSAKIGQVATVVGCAIRPGRHDMVYVVYPGCSASGDDHTFPHAEGWLGQNTQLVPDQNTIEWEKSEYLSECYINGFKFASVYRPLGPCGRVHFSTWTLATQIPYKPRNIVGTFRTREAAMEYAEAEAADLRAIGLFKPGVR